MTTDYLFSPNQRQVLLSMFDRIESECGGADDAGILDSDDEASATLLSSPSRSTLTERSAEPRGPRHQDGSRRRRRRRLFRRRQQSDSCQAPVMGTVDSQLFPRDGLSCGSDLHSAVASVSTVQATDTAAVTAVGASSGGSRHPARPSLASTNAMHGDAPCGSTEVTKRQRKSGNAPRRRRQRARPTAVDPQTVWKRELFSQFLCSGLSEEDQRENLLCLLRATRNRSFCIRADQRKKFTDLQLAAKRRDAPVRVNRTTQLRMQRVDDARVRQRSEAAWLTQHLSVGWQQRQQQRQKQRLQKRQQLQQQQQRESAADRDPRRWQPQQRNRNALTSSQSYSLSTVTSPSPSLAAEEEDGDGSSDSSSSISRSSSTDTVSLTSLTVALNGIRAQSSAAAKEQRRRIQHYRSQRWYQRQTSSAAGSATNNDDTGTAETGTTATAATTTTLTVTATAGSQTSEDGSSSMKRTIIDPTNRAPSSSDREVPTGGKSEAGDTRPESAFRFATLTEASSSTSPKPTPVPRRRLGRQTPDFQLLQRRLEEQKQAANNVDGSESDQRVITLEKLRQEFFQGVDERLFGTASHSNTSKGTNNDSGPSLGSPATDTVGGRLFWEFNNLKGELGQLLEDKRMARNPDASPGTQAELLSKNQRKLSAKVRQLDSLIERVKAHLDGGAEAASNAAVEVGMVADAVDGVQQRFAELIGLDVSANAAAEIPAKFLWDERRSPTLYDSPENPLRNHQSAMYRQENPVCLHCSSPVHNQTISSSGADVSASGCCHPVAAAAASSCWTRRASAIVSDDCAQGGNDNDECSECPGNYEAVANSAEAVHARRIVAQLRQQLELMRTAGGRFRSLGDPLAALDRRRRASRQRAVDRDPSEARLMPIILRYRKWPPGSPQFQAFAKNRCNWCKRYREPILPLWTRAIRLDLSLHEPIGQSLVLLSSRLGKPMSPDWVLSTNAFPDDSCPGKAVVLDLVMTPHQADLKPWQTVFVCESDLTGRLAESTARAAAAAASRRLAIAAASANAPKAMEEACSTESSDVSTLLAAIIRGDSSQAPTPAFSFQDAQTVTVRAPQTVRVGERVAASISTVTPSANFCGDATPAVAEAEAEAAAAAAAGHSYCSLCRFTSSVKGDIYECVRVEKGAGSSCGTPVSGDVNWRSSLSGGGPWSRSSIVASCVPATSARHWGGDNCGSNALGNSQTVIQSDYGSIYSSANSARSDAAAKVARAASAAASIQSSVL